MGGPSSNNQTTLAVTFILATAAATRAQKRHKRPSGNLANASGMCPPNAKRIFQYSASSSAFVDSRSAHPDMANICSWQFILFSSASTSSSTRRRGDNWTGQLRRAQEKSCQTNNRMFANSSFVASPSCLTINYHPPKLLLLYTIKQGVGGRDLLHGLLLLTR